MSQLGHSCTTVKEQTNIIIDKESSFNFLAAG